MSEQPCSEIQTIHVVHLIRAHTPAHLAHSPQKPGPAQIID